MLDTISKIIDVKSSGHLPVIIIGSESRGMFDCYESQYMQTIFTVRK